MILKEEDEMKKAGYIQLITLTREVLETCIHLLGFEAPERMTAKGAQEYEQKGAAKQRRAPQGRFCE